MIQQRTISLARNHHGRRLLERLYVFGNALRLGSGAWVVFDRDGRFVDRFHSSTIKALLKRGLVKATCEVLTITDDGRRVADQLADPSLHRQTKFRPSRA